jgi:hypothetical protein
MPKEKRETEAGESKTKTPDQKLEIRIVILKIKNQTPEIRNVKLQPDRRRLGRPEPGLVF